jgi:thiamine kinase-like enzyme
VPEPLGYTESVAGHEGLLVTRAIDGQSLTEATAAGRPHDESAVRAFARSLARLHALPLTSHSIRFDGKVWPDWRSFVVGAVQEYLRDIESMGGSLPAKASAGVYSVVESHERELSSVRIGAVHGDPTFGNGILASRRVFLIDFEVAHFGDSLMDLAITQLLEFSERRDGWQALTDEYGLPLDRAAAGRLRLYQIMRQVRLLRGKIWIHRDMAGFAKDLERLEQLLEMD